MKTRKGFIVDIFSKRIFKGRVDYDFSGIKKIVEENNDSNCYILPGFVDSHIHIESTMLSPSEFARTAVSCGTISVLADPHEIANVCGKKGLDYMIESADRVPLKIYFGIPSCVPATPFEINGAEINSKEINNLFKTGKYKFLGELMNVPGVLFENEEVLSKIKAAKQHSYPIDGHAPSLGGDKLKVYVNAGISTDHEYVSYENTIEKIQAGLKIQIREGSASKDFEHIYKLIDLYPEKVMLCTDDSHPYDLLNYGHIDKIVRMAVKKDLNIFNILRAACVNPVEHYNIEVGLLREGDKSDFIIVDSLDSFNILETIIEGESVFSKGICNFSVDNIPTVNNFNAKLITKDDIVVEDKGRNIKVIDIKDGSLISDKLIVKPKVLKNRIVQDLENDILKIVLVNRYSNVSVQLGFIRGMGINTGAIAGSIAHDSHNILAVGSNDEDIVGAVNILIEVKGGLSTCIKGEIDCLPLEIAGLMSDRDIDFVNKSYERLLLNCRFMGSKMDSPFMTMAFMSLVVIPELKLGTGGLFEFSKFDFVSLYEEQ